MTFQYMLTSFLIGLGSIMMGLSIFKTARILTLLKDGRYARSWRLLIFLMIFFLGSSRLSVVIVKSPSDFEKKIIVISKAKSNSFDDFDLVIDAF